MNDAQLLNSLEQQTLANYEKQPGTQTGVNQSFASPSLEQEVYQLRRELYSLQQQQQQKPNLNNIEKAQDPRLEKVVQLSSFLNNAVQLLKCAPNEGQVFTQTLDVIKQVTSAWANSDFNQAEVKKRTLRERYEEGDTLDPEETKQLLDELLKKHDLEDGATQVVSKNNQEIETNYENKEEKIPEALESEIKAVETIVRSTSLENGEYEAEIQNGQEI